MASPPPPAQQASKANDDLAVILAEETTGKVSTRGRASCAVLCSGHAGASQARRAVRILCRYPAVFAVRPLDSECLQSRQPVLC